MQSFPPSNQLPSPTDPDSAEIINFPALKNWVMFAVRAVRMKKRLVLGVAIGFMAVAALVANVIPKTYRVQCKLLAQRNHVLALHGDNGGGDSSPTRAAADLVMRRENIVALVKQTNLLQEWRAKRPLLYRIKDRVTAMLGSAPDEKRMIEGLADFLASKTSVWADDTTVSIQVEWRDPVLAYRLVDAAQRGFLEAKHVQEVSSVAESASILEGHAAAIRDQIDTAVTDIQTLRERKKKEETEKSAAPPPPAPSHEPAPVRPAPMPAAPKETGDPEALARQQRRLSELPVMLESKERAINELDGFRLRRLAELQSKLAEQKAIYTDQHPAVADVQQAIQSAATESPQVARLRAEAKQLRTEYEELKQAAGIATKSKGGFGFGRPSTIGQSGGLGDVIRIEQQSAEERDPEIEYARAKLRFAIQTYQTLQEQIHQARIDLDTAQAAFKYRYTMVTPPEIPRGPVGPKVPLIIIGALIGGLLIGVVGALGITLREGIVFEAWQVERATSLSVLAGIQVRDVSQSA